MLARDLDQRLEHRLLVDRAGRIVRVDHYQRARARRDLRAQVVEVGLPAAALVAQVMHRLAAAQVHRRGPQRVVGRRDQHVIAVVDQALHRHHDELGDAVADVDVVDVDAGDAELLVILHDRLARRVDTLRVAVALRLRDVVDHVAQDFLGRVETPRRRVADVELDDPVAFFLEPLRFSQHRAANVVADLVELDRFQDRARRVRRQLPYFFGTGHVGIVFDRGGDYSRV